MDALIVTEANVQHAQSEVDIDTKISQPSNNKFSQAISSWRDIDLISLLSHLDQTAAEVVANQQDALIERKDVAQKTKDFRKLDDAGKLAEYKTLLKGYQSFIDLLTNHNKTASSAFLQIYKPLSEAPDPFPLLEASVEALVNTEDTLPRLTSENEELQKRVGRLTVQLDEIELRLQAESKLRQQDEDVSSARVAEIEASWSRVLAEKESNWMAKEKSLEEKLENQDHLLKELKASYEVTERLGQNSDEGIASLNKAASAELGLAYSDLEKTTARLAEMEARNEELRMDLARASAQHSKASEEDTNTVRLQTENSALLRKFESIRFERDAEKGDWSSKLRQLERQRSSVADENLNLKSKLQRFSDYDEVKRELTMLKTIELSVENDLDTDETQANGVNGDSKTESLEQLLLSRNKKISNELTLLRVSHQELQAKFGIVRADLAKVKEELEQSQKLSSMLETDLLRVQEEAADALPSSGMSVAGTYTSRYPASSRRGRSSPTSSIISGFDGQARLGSTTLEALRSGEPVGGGSGILPMVQAQRDRFRQKNSQLEEELQKVYATVTNLRQEVASLQRDNLNLYEKTRYISTYNRGNNASSSTAYSQAPTHTSISSMMDNDTNDRWKSQYEDNISPFAAFRGREVQKQFRKMTLPERLIFSTTRIVLASRTSRNLFGVYLCGLHLLVLCMLWMWASTSSSSSPLGRATNAALAESGPSIGRV